MEEDAVFSAVERRYQNILESDSPSRILVLNELGEIKGRVGV